VLDTTPFSCSVLTTQRIATSADSSNTKDLIGSIYSMDSIDLVDIRRQCQLVKSTRKENAESELRPSHVICVHPMQ